MERLTERNPAWIDDELWESACEPDCEEIDAVYRRLKNYEDLEEQNRFIKLPCKVGDIVYIISRNNEIIPLNVYGINIRKDDFTILAKNEKYRGYSILLLLSKYESVDWFLTKAEAEMKLKELKCSISGRCKGNKDIEDIER